MQDNQTIDATSIMDARLKKSRNKYLIWIAALIVFNIAMYTAFIKMPGYTYTSILLLVLKTCLFGFNIIGFMLGTIVALLPYKGLPYAKKYLRASILSIFVIHITLAIGLVGIAIMTFMGWYPPDYNRSKYVLTSEERHICDTLQLDSGVVKDIRIFNQNKIQPFHYSLAKEMVNGTWREINPVYLQGLVFDARNTESYKTVLTLKEVLKQKGYSIFLLENNFGIDNRPDHIGVLKTTDPYVVLKQIGTDGINYDIDTDSLVTIMKQFNAQYSLELIGASGEWCEFLITKEPKDWLSFAREVYAVCPDVVDQGTGTVEVLAEEMKKDRRLYFWWD